MMNVGQHMDAATPSQNEQEAMRQRVEAVHRYREESMSSSKANKKPTLVKTIMTCGRGESKQPPSTARPFTALDEDAMAQVIR